MKRANKSILPYGMVPYDLTFLLEFNHQTKFDSALKQHKLATNCFTIAIQVVKGVSKKLFDV